MSAVNIYHCFKAKTASRAWGEEWFMSKNFEGNGVKKISGIRMSQGFSEQ